MPKYKDRFWMKQAVGVATVLLIVYIQRKGSSPDFFRTISMQMNRGVKRFAQGQADMWQSVADKAATSYNKAKL